MCGDLLKYDEDAALLSVPKAGIVFSRLATIKSPAILLERQGKLNDIRCLFFVYDKSDSGHSSAAQYARFGGSGNLFRRGPDDFVGCCSVLLLAA